MSNEALFDELRQLGLDPSRYAISGSGPLGIRGIRPINDVDLVVEDALFAELAREHTNDQNRVVLSPAIEAFRDAAFPPQAGVPSVAEQIATAELIDGLPFVTLETVIAIKSSKRRPKDLADLELIGIWRARGRGA